MRVWPDTLAGRTLALMLGMSIVLVIGSALLLFDERHEQFDQRNQFHFVKRVATLVKLVSDASQEDQLLIIKKFSVPGDHITITEKPLIATPSTHQMEHLLSHKLRRVLKLQDKTAVSVRLSIDNNLSLNRRQKRDDDNKRNHRRYTHDVAAVLVSIRLKDNTWLNIKTENFEGPPPWAGKTLQLFALLIVLLILSSLFLARRMSLPLIKLGQAAESFGLGQSQSPLEEKGPKEVRQTIQAFNLMQERLHKQISDRSLMLAAVSHDLRTPITILRLRAEYIEDEDIRNKTLETLAEMEEILNTTLSFARDEAADELGRETNLAALVQSLVDDHKDLGGHIHYLGPDKLIYCCRPISLRRAINNLIENALCYGEKTEINLTETKKDFLITIDDNGPGIPEEQLEQVFTPFYRLEESRNKSTGGTGLGLAVAKSIILAHGGELTLKNISSGGLRATILLPMRR